MPEGVLTGALALVRKNGTTIGHMRSVRVNENIGRGTVKGLGTIFTIEAPAVDHAGTISCEFYEVDFNTTGIPDAIKRDVQTNKEFEDQLLMNSEGVQIDIFKKIEDVVDPDTGLFKTKVKPHAIVRRCFIEVDGLDITEGAVSGHNQSFRFLDPILRPI